MAANNQGFTVPAIAASAIPQYVPVKGLPAGSSVDNTVVQAAAVTDDVLGVTIASTPTYGYAVAVQVSGEVKMLFAASCGAISRVAVASTNGGVGPVAASGILASGVGASGTIQAARYSIGWVKTNVGAGEYGTVVLDPREVI